jgi:Flp pilus assembly pilin Flp
VVNLSILGWLPAFLSGSIGATAAEFAIMASVIAVVIMRPLRPLGLSVNGLFASAADAIP